jgi:hypothetical protein
VRRASKLDVAIGLAVGAAIGLVIVYMFVIGIGTGRDSSGISVPQAQPPGREAPGRESKTGPSGEETPAPHGQRR